MVYLDAADILQKTFEMINGIPGKENQADKDALMELLRNMDEKVSRTNKAFQHFDNERKLKEIDEQEKPLEAMKGIKTRMLEEYQNLAAGYPVEELDLNLPKEQEKEQIQEEENDGEDEENEDEEGEDLVGQVTYVNKDPFTKQKIEKPLKNTHCGHVYDEKSVIMMLEKEKNSAGIKCPNVGCANNQRFKAEDLEPFPDFFKHCRP